MNHTAARKSGSGESAADGKKGRTDLAGELRCLLGWPSVLTLDSHAKNEGMLLFELERRVIPKSSA